MNEWIDIESWLNQQKETKDAIEQTAETLAFLYKSLVEKGLPSEVAANLTALFLHNQFELLKK